MCNLCFYFRGLDSRFCGFLRLLDVCDSLDYWCGVVSFVGEFFDCDFLVYAYMARTFVLTWDWLVVLAFMGCLWSCGFGFLIYWLVWY